jgi:hypothetical protein
VLLKLLQGSVGVNVSNDLAFGQSASGEQGQHTTKAMLSHQHSGSRSQLGVSGAKHANLDQQPASQNLSNNAAL